EMASFDAWIKFYRPDENTSNSSISYYTKGAVIAFLLDAKIRRSTHYTKSLDDVMRTEYEKFSGPKGYTPDEVRAVAEQVAATSLKPFWESVVETASELDYADALDALGLRFRTPPPPPADRPGKAWLGLATRIDNGRLVVTQVQRDSPADVAGIN